MISAALAALLAAAQASAEPADSRVAAMVQAVSANDLRDFDTRLAAFPTRNDFSTTVFAARDWIRAQFEAAARTSGGRMTVTLDTFVQPKTPRTPRSVTESSVIATLQGDSGAPVYVISSHFDDCNGRCTDGTGIAPGADDNGSGTAAVIEAAKVMAATRFHATIIFACFDGEELGLWGSDHFARELKARGIRVAGNLNNDIIGAPNLGPGAPGVRGIRIFSEALPAAADVERVNLTGSENDSPSRELARFAQATAAQYVPQLPGVLIDRADRFLRGGDQESFTAQGIPAIRFVEMREDFRHQHQDVRMSGGVQYGDLPQFIDDAYLADATRVNVAVLGALALGPEPPRDVRMEVRHLTNDTTLHWQRVPGAAFYEIVWRATTAAQWESSKNVGDADSATVPVSKDDFIVGVRSVDARGLRSPAVTNL